MTFDMPAFAGFYDYACLTAGSSLLAAELLATQRHDTVLNWLGGMHHARKCKAHGFCYVNDCVLAILRLAQDFHRILYIDIDVHHGDGVEEAFLNTNRVMTLSFHQYDPDGHFFPGTGSIGDVGVGEGKYYAVNVPLLRGCTDSAYDYIFRKVLDKVIQRYAPQCIVLQSGADSLVGDKLGGFNVSLRGHAEAFKYVLSKGLPTLCLGGGGYTPENVARCWANESALAVNVELDNNLPENLEYYFAYSKRVLHYNPQNVHGFTPDQNNRSYLEKLLSAIDENLKKVEAVPVPPFKERPFMGNYAEKMESFAAASKSNKNEDEDWDDVKIVNSIPKGAAGPNAAKKSGAAMEGER